MKIIAPSESITSQPKPNKAIGFLSPKSNSCRGRDA